MPISPRAWAAPQRTSLSWWRSACARSRTAGRPMRTRSSHCPVAMRVRRWLLDVLFSQPRLCKDRAAAERRVVSWLLANSLHSGSMARRSPICPSAETEACRATAAPPSSVRISVSTTGWPISTSAVSTRRGYRATCASSGPADEASPKGPRASTKAAMAYPSVSSSRCRLSGSAARRSPSRANALAAWQRTSYQGSARASTRGAVASAPPARPRAFAAAVRTIDVSPGPRNLTRASRTRGWSNSPKDCTRSARMHGSFTRRAALRVSLNEVMGVSCLRITADQAGES